MSATDSPSGTNTYFPIILSFEVRLSLADTTVFCTFCHVVFPFGDIEFIVGAVLSYIILLLSVVFVIVSPTSPDSSV